MPQALLPAYTPGEPAGIGLDLAILAAGQPQGFPAVVIADPALLQQRAELLGAPLKLEKWTSGHSAPPRPGTLLCRAVSAAHPAEAGKLDADNAGYVLETLAVATDGCLSGEFGALVTGPVQKSIINEAGISFSGHTEWLAERSGGAHPVMMLATPGLRVALASTHLPLREVADHITPEILEKVLRITHATLRDRFAIEQPHIAVCGLNPHAGESGHLGREEQEIIEPVLEKLRVEGLNLEGPLPADTAFTPPYMARSDAFLAMYHDQGLPVLKHLGFGQAVNVTLGLPIIRTSVDHGTALDLAGTGNISLGSLNYALEVALEQMRGQS